MAKAVEAINVKRLTSKLRFWFAVNAKTLVLNVSNLSNDPDHVKVQIASVSRQTRVGQYDWLV